MSTTEAHVNQNLRKLVEAGCSPWLDLLRRSLVESGELARMAAEDSLRGVTSNPSIFQKAILGSDEYDEHLAELAGQGLEPQAIYEQIAIKDVQMACDVLHEVWDAHHHQDGFVSLEISADMAHDQQRSIDAARDFWKRVDRRNVMIKIPGTPEGMGAVERALYEGINVNITLLFAVEAYENVVEAYLSAMERRLAEGKSLDVASVASFFVSRVDTAVDKRLHASGHEELLGKAAIANARHAYQVFQEKFSGPRWDALHHAGAHYQRPLWASTSVKDERYPDTMYVDELVAPHTVNTMPLETLEAVGDHGHISGPLGTRDPSEDLEALARAGVDMSEVTDELLADGVKKFEDAMNELLAGIAERTQR